MVVIIGRLALLVAMLAGWALSLWFLIRPDFDGMSTAWLLVIHGVPPLHLWAAVLGLARFRRQRIAAQAMANDEARHREDAAAADASRARHEAEIAHRRYHLSVLAAVLGGWRAPGPGGVLVAAAELVAVLPTPDDTDPLDVADHGAAAILGPHLDDVLRETYELCPGAASLPVRVLGPADLRTADLSVLIRTVVGDAMRLAGAEPHVDDQTDPLPVDWLPPGACLAEALFGMFDAHPLLPGVVVVGVDSPYARELAAARADEEPTSAQAERRRWHGQPAQGVVAVVLANPALGQMLGQVAESQAVGHAGVDADTGLPRPYWQATQDLAAHLRPLAALDADVRERLAAMVPLAYVHRPELAECRPRAGRVVHFSAAARRALERGLVNSGLLSLANPALPGEDGATVSPPEEVSPGPPGCDWLVHNAGGIDRAGQRLAALSLAFNSLGIELNPIDEATNFPARIGDLGAARSVAMLAQAVNKAAELAAPACWVEFSEGERFHVGFVMPADTPLGIRTMTVPA